MQPGHLVERPLKRPRNWVAPATLAGAGALMLVAPAQAQVRIQPQAASGTLYLSDFFESNDPQQIPHGEIVYRSARQLGFQGPVVRHEAPENALTHKAHRFDAYLDQRQFTPDEMRQFLSDYSVQCLAGQTQSATQDLKMFLEQGAQHSAINLSRGCSPAQVVESVYGRVQAAFSANSDPVASGLAQRRLLKIAPGLDSKPDELLSSEAKINGPARLHFQQQLVDLVQKALQDPQVSAAQQDYDQTVQRLAQRKVSVLVAAANSGEVLEHLARDAQDARVRLSADFWRNRLAIPEAVTVGATRIRDGRQQVTEYTNYDSGIDFYADGDAYFDPANPDKLVNYGTSFATPRLASVVARAHQQQLDWSNTQVEAFVHDQLAAKQLDLKGHSPASALDPARAEGYLKK